jgi:hypothetical protein
MATLAVREAAVPDALREGTAYREGLRAFAFGYPWVHMATLRYLWTNVPQNVRHVPYAPLNRFWHQRRMPDDTLRDGALPNLDTPYSTAWLDLRAEPVVLSHRDMGATYFAFDFVGMDLVRFASVGAALTGPAAAAFAIRGPDWRGRLPRGVMPLPRSTTDRVLLVGRTQADPRSDLGALREAQDGYRIVPLSCWPDGRLPPESRSVLAPLLPRDDPLADWITMNWAMTADPPRRMPLAIEGWAHVGIGIGLQVDTQSEATRRGLARAAIDGRRSLAVRAAAAVGAANDGWVRVPPVGEASALAGGLVGWQSPAPGFGWRPDVVDGAMVRPVGADLRAFPATAGRAGLEIAAALAVNPAHGPAEFVAVADGGGRALRGPHAYRLRFPPGSLPPARFAWSLTLYGRDHNLVAAAGQRHSVGTVASDFVRDADGGTTIAIQPSRPESGVNWLPGPPDGREVHLVLRVQDGRAVAVTGWRPPAIEAVEPA